MAYPLYKPWKGVDQVREGQGWSLVNLGTASHQLMDRYNLSIEKKMESNIGFSCEVLQEITAESASEFITDNGSHGGNIFRGICLSVC